MPSTLLARFASLFLLIVLLLSGVSASAADGSPYERAVRRGRILEHRPNYRLYKPIKHHRGGAMHRLLKKTLRDK
jgi:hypothetical protein